MIFKVQNPRKNPKVYKTAFLFFFVFFIVKSWISGLNRVMQGENGSGSDQVVVYLQLDSIQTQCP